MLADSFQADHGWMLLRASFRGSDTERSCVRAAEGCEDIEDMAEPLTMDSRCQGYMKPIDKSVEVEGDYVVFHILPLPIRSLHADPC